MEAGGGDDRARHRFRLARMLGLCSLFSKLALPTIAAVKASCRTARKRLHWAVTRLMLILGTILAVYIIVRGIAPLRVASGWKIALAAFTLLVAFKFHVLHWFGGPMFFAPELPPLVLEMAAWLFAVLLIFFVLLLAADVANGLARLARRLLGRRGAPWSRGAADKLRLALLAIAVVLATVGMFEGTRVPEARRETLVFENLPPEADGMTVAVLADLHVDSMVRSGRLGQIVDRTNALTPDLIVIVGDFVDGPVSLRGVDMRPLRRLSARYGVYGVPGNHEYYSGYEAWMAFLPTLGIRMLPNAHVAPGPKGLVLAGVTDPAAARMGGELPDCGKALRGVAPGAFRILLAHQPILADEAAAHGVDLQLSGHTHGGMIAGFDRIVAAFNRGFVSGAYDVGRMKLEVSNGSGIWNGFPIRLGVPPEIVFLTLRRGS